MSLYNFLIGIAVLVLGIPIGIFLARFTKEELHAGERWFKLIVFASLALAIISLFLRNDYLLFTFLFIAIVTGMSLNKKKIERKRKRN